MNIPSVFLNHVLLSIIPWVAGGLIGGGLGVGVIQMAIARPAKAEV